MQSFFSSVTSKVLATAAALVADENDDELAPASVSLAEVEFAEVSGGLRLAAAGVAAPAAARAWVRAPALAVTAGRFPLTDLGAYAGHLD